MKNTKTFNLILIIALLLPIVLFSCSKRNYLRLTVTEPAPVGVPNYIKRVGIVDRTLPASENEKIQQIDNILNLKGKSFDKDGANAAVTGLAEALRWNERFAEVKLIDTVRVRNPGLGIFPSPLSWNEVRQICQENGVDALFTLAVYDTDAKVAYRATPVEINGPFGVKVPGLEHHVSIATLIKTGWRIYDPVSELILDEFYLNNIHNSSGIGINPLRAAEAIIGRKDAVLQISKGLGESYSSRILPFNLRVTREYFVRGTLNFRIGKRMAQTGNWNGAAELWQREVTSSRRRIAGRAHYNMAIINEINGDLIAAMDWASTSYTNYRNRHALRYLNILGRRMERFEQLQRQMEH
ncbi:MAG: DUF6340 family protein [Bacteroidota bacterium]|nr:DUF6340 family protein [Bacteroidota bacterium]